MTDSADVLGLMKVVYAIYLVVVFAMMGAFVLAITRKTRVRPGFRVPFYGWVALLVGLRMTIFAAVYALFPMLTNNLQLKSMRLTNFHFWAHLIGSVGMSVAMGFAGMSGMLRRTLYVGDTTFQTEMIAAAAFGTLILLSYLALMYNFISSLGVRGLVEIFVRLPGSRSEDKAEAPAQA